MESIGKAIKEVIRKKRISFYRVAKDLNIDHASFHRSFRDDSNPEWKRIKLILDYLDYDIVLRPKKKKVKTTKSNPSRSRRRRKEGI
jgi:hypothetical protein